MGRTDTGTQGFMLGISEHLFRLTTESLRLHSNETNAYQTLGSLIDARAENGSRIAAHDMATLSEHLAVIPTRGNIQVELIVSANSIRHLNEVKISLSEKLEDELTLGDAMSLMLFDYIVEQKASRLIAALDLESSKIPLHDAANRSRH